MTDSRATRTRRTAAAVLALLLPGLLALAGPGAVAAAAEGEDVHVQKSTDDTGDPVSSWRTYLELMLIPSAPTDHVPPNNAPLKTGRNACPRSRCRDYAVRVPAGVNVSSNKVRVLFPRGYFRKKNRKERYPVVYLYNGARSPYYRWSEATELVQISRPLPAILVMPEGGIGEEAGMFTDWKDGSWHWETFHTDVLTAWADRRFRTNGKRGTLGASMGGLGALIYPARNPGLFQAAFTLSGAVDTNLMSGNILPPELAKAVGISPPDLRRVWGNPVLDRATWDAHNPVMLADELRGVEVLVAGGTGYPSNESETGDALHTGYVEQLMWTGHRTFLAALTEAGVPYSAWVRQGGVHNWPWFDAPLRWGLPKLVAALR